MNNAKIIAVDFDGTLVENKWPEIGAPIEKNIAKVKAEQEAGAKIILWTNRVGEPLEKALSFCKEQGIHLDAVNENLPEIIKAFGTDCRKIFANEYWDDRAVLMSEKDIGEFSDGFHTFNSLYYQRLILFAALVNTFPTLAWKSHKHSDGEAPFGGGWFIVGIDTPKGPYFPADKKFKIIVEEFLTDEKNGDFDTVGYLQLILPNGEVVDLNGYFKDGPDGMVRIEQAEYEERKANRIDKK